VANFNDATITTLVTANGQVASYSVSDPFLVL
jgi:hypothetical protein